MFKFLLLFFISSIFLFAATPKLYKPIGDPIYNEIPAVISLSKMNYFKKDKVQFLDFINKAKSHKKLGFTYDRKKKQKTLTKVEQRTYLNGIRRLDKSLRQIYFIVKNTLPRIIKTNYTKTFYRLLKTRLDILYLDPKTAKSIKAYKYKLNKRKRIARQKQVKKEKDAKTAHYNFLRSSKNLDGKWKGKNTQKETMSASFHDDIVYLTYASKGQVQVFKGSYKIYKNTFTFNIQQRKRTKKDISHIKKVKFQRKYIIKKISKTQLNLQYKDETIYLKRKSN